MLDLEHRRSSEQATRHVGERHAKLHMHLRARCSREVASLQREAANSTCALAMPAVQQLQIPTNHSDH